MTKMSRRILSFSLALSVTMSLLCLPATPVMSAPKTISIMTYDIGSSGYIAYGLLGDAILEKFGTRMRAIPSGNDTGRSLNLLAGKTQFAGQGLDIYFGLYGMDRYANREYGPVDFRVVWIAQQPGWTVGVRADSDIHKVEDLKGKRIGWIPGSVVNNGMEAFLAFGGLTWDDVVKVTKPSYGAQIKSLLDGSCDAMSCNITSSAAYEVASGPHGLRWLQFPPENKEGWARSLKVLPMFTPIRATIGANASEESPVHAFTYPYPGTLCMASLDDDIAYFMTKAIHETYPIHSEKSKFMKAFWTLEGFLDMFEKSSYLILHPGAVRYLKEIGVWKAGWDEEQERRIALAKKVATLWDVVVEESFKKEIKDKDYPDYWNQRRKEVVGF